MGVVDFLPSGIGIGTGVSAGNLTGTDVVAVLGFGVGESADRVTAVIEVPWGGTGIGTGVCDCGGTTVPPGVSIGGGSETSGVGILCARLSCCGGGTGVSVLVRLTCGRTGEASLLSTGSLASSFSPSRFRLVLCLELGLGLLALLLLLLLLLPLLLLVL